MEIENPQSITLAIGSLPYREPKEAMDVVMKYFPQAPFWPQLPSRDRQEQMYNQYSDGIPGLSFNPARKKLVADAVDELFLEAVAMTFEDVMAKNYENFYIPEESAAGLYYFLENSDVVKAANPKWIKGQITGPLSLCLVTTDSKMKPILYEESYREVVTAALKMKAVWMIQKMKEVHPNVIVIVDEPYFASVGSSMVATSAQDAIKMTAQVVEAINQEGALSGIHCCGNTDWGALLQSGCRILSLDAYDYGENLLLYLDGLSSFLRTGGMIAWGIVPTSEAVENETVESIMKRLEEFLRKIEVNGIRRERTLAQSFISPSCGLGSVSAERAEKIMQLNSEVSDQLRKKYGLEHKLLL